jgi:hypothetical protein
VVGLVFKDYGEVVIVTNYFLVRASRVRFQLENKAVKLPTLLLLKNTLITLKNYTKIK